MGATTIKQVFNRTTSQVVVRNFENADPKGPSLAVIEPGQMASVSVVIPWCTSAADFPKHHMHFEVIEGLTYSVWQANRRDGDFVRQSLNRAWADPGDRPDGLAKVDGDRRVFVTGAPKLTFEALAPTGQDPATGLEHVPLRRPSAATDPFLYRGASFTPGRAITFVKNVATTKDGAQSVDLSIRFTERASTQSVQTDVMRGLSVQAPFAGLLLDGTWEVRAINISAAFLKDDIIIDVGWKKL